MKTVTIIATLLGSLGMAACASAPPIAPGEYTFRHRFAEHPSMGGAPLLARIDGRHIVLINPTATGPLPEGAVAEGTLMWHAASRRWIIGDDDADRYAPEVGGCSDGPEVVDVRQRIYWTC